MQCEHDESQISQDSPCIQLNLPNVYRTMFTPLATIIGMYTNDPEGGSIDSTQQQWVTHEFSTAPKDRALILALHHPVYSFDVYHSGSSKMAAAKSWGFVTLTIDKKTISGTTTEVDRTGRATTGDSFSYSAEPIVLADPRPVPTL